MFAERRPYNECFYLCNWSVGRHRRQLSEYHACIDAYSKDLSVALASFDCRLINRST